MDAAYPSEAIFGSAGAGNSLRAGSGEGRAKETTARERQRTGIPR
jgi:hypothetical protein